MAKQKISHTFTSIIHTILKKISHIFSPIQAALVAVLLIATTAVLTSCGSDEPNYRIAYYLEIDSQVDIGLIESDEDQDVSSSDPETSPITTAVKQMKVALRDVYPEPTTEGNDAAVLEALGGIHKRFQSAYAGMTTVTVCIVKLCRAHIDKEGLIQDSRVMAVYQFSLLPVK